MKLQAKLMLTIGLVFLLFFGVVQYFDNEHIKHYYEHDLIAQARSLNAVLMATRSVYHQEFLDRDLLSDEKIMGCLPIHVLGSITKDFMSLENSEISFVNVSGFSAQSENPGTSDQESLSYFIAQPLAKERLIPFKASSGQSYYQYSTPLLVESYCLKCHEERDAALPAGHAGNQTGFNYRVGEMHGVMSIRFSAEMVGVRIRQQMKNNSRLHFAGFLITFLTISLLLKISVISKLESLKKAAARLSGGDLQVRTAIPGTDEIAEVAAAFDAMAVAISERTELLHKSQASLTNAQRIARLGNWDWDILANKWYWSDETYRLLGLQPQEFEPTFATFLELLHPDDRQRLDAAVQQALAGEGGYSLEYRIRLPDENVRYVYDQGEVTFNQMGHPVNMVGTLYDITERMLAEKEVEEKHAFLQTVIDGVADPIMVIDLDYRIIMMNRSASPGPAETRISPGGLFCYQVSHHAEHPCNGVAHPCPLEEVRRTGELTTVVHDHTMSSGEVRTFELQATPFLDEDGTLRGIIEASRDITDRVAAETQLRENELRLKLLAHHDTLTNLPNRLLFHDRLVQAMVKARRSAQQVALLFLDLDRFKNINDSLGHGIGDRVLLEVSKRLADGVREADTVARFGGDEFVIIMDDVHDEARVAGVAQKLLDSVARVLKIDGHELFVTSSIGISLFPSDGVDVEGLMKCADVAMYRAKEQGRNTYQFYRPDMNARTHELLLLEGHLRQALELEQFVLHYQPQIDLLSGRLVGLEALLRWQHPEQGLIQPNDFVPLAEETGLIVPIGEWVLEEACVQIKSLQQAGWAPGNVSVNISSRQIKHPGFIAMIDRVLEKTGFDPRCLVLEITESSLMDNVEKTIQTLEVLRVRGINLSIDDFGTGYSSLSYLKRFPISQLKIDRSFINDITVDTNDEAIAASVIALSLSMNMKVIAEGVETEEQLQLLRQMKCDQVQGFLISRPLPFGKLEDFMRRPIGGSS